MRLLLVGFMVLLCACTPSRPSAGPSTDYSTITRTVAAPTPTAASAPPTGPLETASVSATSAATCPLLDQATAAGSIGMRLSRIAVLKQGSMLVGCRFYALQDSALSTSEHLPGPNQPALEIVTAAYASSAAARNAAVALAVAGTSQHVVTLNGGVQGDVFQTRFDPQDGKFDWVLVFNKAATLVTVKTAVKDTSLDAINIGDRIVTAVG